MKTISYCIALLALLVTIGSNGQPWQKHDIDGTEVPIKMGPWACATDLGSGLTWEVKSWQENIHYYKATYSYYHPDHKQGVKDGGSCQQGQEWYPCDVTDLINKLNQQNYCGINHWRLPSEKELATLIYDKNLPGKLQINPYIFPRATRNIYMTGDIKRINGEEKITMMDFWRGKVQQRPLNVVANVRLVASPPQTNVKQTIPRS